jgi:hypothetical protein
MAARIGDQSAVDRYERLAAMLRVNLDTTYELRIVPTLTEPTFAGGISHKASGMGRYIGLSDLLIPGIPRVVPALALEPLEP